MVHVAVTHRVPPAQIPGYSLLALALMSAVAAGIPEEVGFRRYMQVPIERRHGPLFGVLFVAFVFALAHLNHGVSVSLVFDFLFGVAFDILAYRANSLLPGATLHCLLDAILFVLADVSAPCWTLSPSSGPRAPTVGFGPVWWSLSFWAPAPHTPLGCWSA
jgi:membrane protease YdiL (CAAX protease family)